VGTLFGPVIGSIVLTVIEELSRSSFGGTGRGTDTVIYAGLIVVVAVFYPSGIVGWFKERAARRRARHEGAAQAAPPLASNAQESTGAAL